jgi:hypothetical protein
VKRSDDVGTTEDGYRSDHAAAPAPVSLPVGGSRSCLRARQVRACIEERDLQRAVLHGTLSAPPAQAAGILAFKTVDVVPDDDTRFYFVAIDNARFRKPVEPGDQLILKVVLKRAFKGIWKFACIAEVDNQEVASADIMVAPETKGPRVVPAPAAGDPG